MINTLLTSISELMKSHLWISPILALIAGVFTSFTPCALSSVPLVIGYVGGTGQKSTKKAFRLSVIFALGSAITFTILGLVASSFGKLLGNSASWWYLVLGTLMTLMALQTWEVINIIPATYLVSKNTKQGELGAFIAGILSGLFSSPCATPVLVVLLSIIAASKNLLFNMVLMLFYSIGHSTLTIIAGTSMSFVSGLKTNPHYHRLSDILKYTMGLAIFALGLYMFYLGF